MLPYKKASLTLFGQKSISKSYVWIGLQGSVGEGFVPLRVSFIQVTKVQNASLKMIIGILSGIPASIDRFGTEFATVDFI